MKIKSIALFLMAVLAWFPVQAQAQGAKNASTSTTNAEEDNVNVPIYKSNTTAYRITATHPTYTTTMDGRSADFSGLPEGPVIWELGVDDDSPAEFPSAPVQSSYAYYPPENPPVGRSDGIHLMPKRFAANGVNNLSLYFTLKDGYEKNNEWALTIDFAEVVGNVGVSLTYYVGDVTNPFLHEITSGQRKVFYTGASRQTFYFNPGGNRYWRPGTDQIYVKLQFSSDTAGAYAMLDTMRLEARVPGIWSIGSKTTATPDFKASGFSNGDVYFVQEHPPVGTDEASIQCPQELNDATMTDQTIRFSTESGTETKIGGTFTVDMGSVTGTLVVKLWTWNGSGWVDRGVKSFSSAALSQSWMLPDGAFMGGNDANQFRLDVISSTEPATPRSTAGARGVYTFMKLVGRALAADQFTTLFDANGTKVVGVKVDGWWQAPNAMTVGVIGGSTLTGCHYLQVYKQIPGQSGLPPQVFVLYQDGNARIIPFKKAGQVLDPPYGSSVIIGPAAESARPFVDIGGVTIHPQNLTADVTYRDGKKALLTIAPAADRSKTVVDVTGVTYDTVTRPFATLRSMWVRNGNSDVDTVQTTAGEFPILGSWTLLDGVSWFFKRNVPSRHNTLAPDIKIERTAGTAPAPVQVYFNAATALRYGGTGATEAYSKQWLVWDFGTNTANGWTGQRLLADSWAATPCSYNVTPNTVVEFDYYGSTISDISGIGFDNDLNESADRFFQLIGTRTWGLQNYRNVWVGPYFNHMVIPIGQFFTGQIHYIVLATDRNDPYSATPSNYFNNLIIRESN